MRLGLDIRLVGTAGLTWRRLLLLIGQLARDTSSGLWRALTDEPVADPAEKRFGTAQMTIEETDEWLGW